MKCILIILQICFALYSANAAPTEKEINEFGSLTGTKFLSYIIHNLPARMDPLILAYLGMLDTPTRISILYIYKRCVMFTLPESVIRKLERYIVSGLILMIRNQNPELMMNALKKAEYKMEQIENRMENKFIVVAGSSFYYRDTKIANYRFFVYDSRLHYNSDLFKQDYLTYSLVPVLVKFYPKIGCRLVFLDNFVMHMPKVFIPHLMAIKQQLYQAIKVYLEDNNISNFSDSVDKIYNLCLKWLISTAPDYDSESEKKLLEILKLPRLIHPALLGYFINIPVKYIISDLIEYFDKAKFLQVNDQYYFGNFQLELIKAFENNNVSQVKTIIDIQKLKLQKLSQDKKIHRFPMFYDDPSESIPSYYNGSKQIQINAIEHVSTLSELHEEILTLPPDISYRLILLNYFEETINKNFMTQITATILVAVKEYARNPNEKEAIHLLKHITKKLFNESFTKICNMFSLWDKWEQFIRQKQLFKPIYENRFKTFLQPSKQTTYMEQTFPLFLEAIKLPIEIHPIVLGLFFILPSVTRNMILTIYTYHRIYKTIDENFAFMQIAVAETLLKWQIDHNIEALNNSLWTISKELHFDDTSDNLQIPDYRSIKEMITSIYYPKKFLHKIPQKLSLSNTKKLDQITGIIKYLPQDSILRVYLLGMSLSKLKFDNPVRISSEQAIIDAMHHYFNNMTEKDSSLLLSLKLADIFSKIVLIFQRQFFQERFNLAESLQQFTYFLSWTPVIYKMMNTLPEEIKEDALKKISGKKYILYENLAQDLKFKWMTINQKQINSDVTGETASSSVMGDEEVIWKALSYQPEKDTTKLYLPKFAYPDILGLARCTDVFTQNAIKKIYDLVQSTNKSDIFIAEMQDNLMNVILSYFEGGSAKVLQKDIALITNVAG